MKTLALAIALAMSGGAAMGADNLPPGCTRFGNGAICYNGSAGPTNIPLDHEEADAIWQGRTTQAFSPEDALTKRAADCKAADDALDIVMARLIWNAVLPVTDPAYARNQANILTDFHGALQARLKLNCN